MGSELSGVALKTEKHQGQNLYSSCGALYIRSALHREVRPLALWDEQDRSPLDHQDMSLTTYSRGISKHQAPRSPHTFCDITKFTSQKKVECRLLLLTRQAIHGNGTEQVPPHGSLACTELIQRPLDCSFPNTHLTPTTPHPNTH